MPKRRNRKRRCPAQVERAPVLYKGRTKRGEGLGGERPVPQNKRCLEDAVPGKPKKNWRPRDRGSQGIAKLLLMS